MIRSFNPFIYRNERNVYDAMLDLPKGGGKLIDSAFLSS